MADHSLLRQLRQERKLTLREVAMAVSSDTSVISAVELGSRFPWRSLRQKLSKFYDVAEEKLFDNRGLAAICEAPRV